MLTVRTEQINVFKEAALSSFSEEMLAHLQEFSPPLFKATGEQGMRDFIKLGISQAAKHGFTFRGPVRFYLELMLLFGSYFDTDPQYFWAAEILTNVDAGSQMQRADRLYNKSMDYLEEVAGPEDIYTIEALNKMTLFVRQPSIIFSENHIPDMLRAIAQLYPKKAGYLGKASLEALIYKGMGGAKRQQFPINNGASLIIMLMFILGHGCGADPIYPWIRKILTDPSIPDPDAKVLALKEQLIAWLEFRLNPDD